jgi:phage-related protein
VVKPPDRKRLPAAFWRSVAGAEPVREWIKQLSKDDKYEIGTAIKTVEYGWPIGMPVCRSLGGGLWEVRVDLAQGRTARVLFCVREGRMVLLHGWMKKTRKTPLGAVALARTRMRALGPESKEGKP